MYAVIIVLIVLASILMCLAVLIQESKGGGLAESFSGMNSLGGVRKTTDFIEKVTWGLAIAMVLCSIAAAYTIGSPTEEQGSALGSAVPTQTQQPQQAQGQPNAAQPAQEQPAQ